MKQIIIDYLLNNEHSIQSYIDELKFNTRDSRLFADIIKQQMIENVRFKIITDICEKNAVDYESVRVILDEMNLGDYFDMQEVQESLDV